MHLLSEEQKVHDFKSIYESEEQKRDESFQDEQKIVTYRLNLEEEDELINKEQLSKRLSVLNDAKDELEFGFYEDEEIPTEKAQRIKHSSHATFIEFGDEGENVMTTIVSQRAKNWISQSNKKGKFVIKERD